MTEEIGGVKFKDLCCIKCGSEDVEYNFFDEEYKCNNCGEMWEKKEPLIFG